MIQPQTKPENGKALKRLDEIARHAPGETIKIRREFVWAKYNHQVHERGLGERETVFEKIEQEIEQGSGQTYKHGESTPIYAGSHS